MLAKIRPFHNTKFQSAIIALLICYAMVVQGFGTHTVAWATSHDAFNRLCIPDPASGQEKSFPNYPAPNHENKVPCCLIFGSGDLPRIDQLISTFNFYVSIALYPATEFITQIDKRLSFSQSRPRGPPEFG